MLKNIIILSLLILLLVSFVFNIHQNKNNNEIIEINDKYKVEYSCTYEDLVIIKKILLDNKIDYSFVKNTMPNWCLIGSREKGILTIFFNNIELDFSEKDQLLIDFLINIDSTLIGPCYRLTTPPQGMEIDF